MKIIDARGETCPVPVIMMKKALKEGAKENIKEIVDNELSSQNLEKMLTEMGLKFTSYQEKGDFVVQVNLEETDSAVPAETPKQDSVLVISSDTMGRGNDELGRTLIKNFLYALNESDSLPAAILLYNTGVKLASENPDTIADLKKLGEKGVDILVCGLCLNYFGLTEKLQAGTVSNMYAIVQKKLSAAKIIQL
jgi:selenium metabolism protein YedF